LAGHCLLLVVMSERPPNASEFSCGFNCPNSTKLLCRAVSYNSSLARRSGRPNRAGQSGNIGSLGDRLSD